MKRRIPQKSTAKNSSPLSLDSIYLNPERKGKTGPTLDQGGIRVTNEGHEYVVDWQLNNNYLRKKNSHEA